VVSGYLSIKTANIFQDISNNIIIDSLSKDKTYEIHLKNNTNVYIGDFEEIVSTTEEINKYLFNIKAYKPKPKESPKFIINCYEKRSFIMDNISIIKEIKRKSMY
jgi:hypothetical protein